MESGEEERIEKNVVVDMNLSISREDKMQETIDFDQVENIKVVDENGIPFRFGDIYKSKKTILILVRHFLCYICKEYVDDLGLIPEKCLQDANVQLVVIGCAKWKFIKAFREATGYQQKMFADSDRKLYKALKCEDSLNFSRVTVESKHVKSGALTGIIQSVWRGMQFCELQGDIEQQGGAFILGPGDVCHFVHRDKSSTDHAPINNLLDVAGLAQLNFKRDKRVLTV